MNSKKSILVVEDNEDVFFFIITVLKRIKVSSVLHAKTGSEAISIFTKNKNNIVLILMDIRLPDMLGYDLAPILLSIKDVHIVAQSAYTDREKAISAGCIDYITKPIKIEKMNKIVNKYFFLI